MKKTFIFLLLLSCGLIAQNITVSKHETQSSNIYKFTTDKNLSVGTYYSPPIEVPFGWSPDSSNLYSIIWFQQQDSVYCDLILEGRYNAANTSSQYYSLATLVNNFRGLGADSVYSKLLAVRGTYNYDSNILTFNGKYANQVRLKYVVDSGLISNGVMQVFLIIPKK